MGQQIMVYTNHKNLVQDALGLDNDQLMRQRLLLVEYRPKIVHIAAITNTVADVSRLDMDHTCKVSEDILEDLDMNDYIKYK